MSAAMVLAGLYALACLGVIGFQIALIAGAPWGRLTQGGGREGPLTAGGRVLAAISAVLLVAMAGGVASLAGAWPGWPAWTGWAAIAVQGASAAANLATRSAPERRLWAPITAGMLALAAAVALLR